MISKKKISDLSTMSSGVNEETDELQPGNEQFDPNKYAITKTVAKAFLNIALLTSNAKQLKTTISEGSAKNPFYEATIAFAMRCQRLASPGNGFARGGQGGGCLTRQGGVQGRGRREIFGLESESLVCLIILL